MGAQAKGSFLLHRGSQRCCQPPPEAVSSLILEVCKTELGPHCSGRVSWICGPEWEVGPEALKFIHSFYSCAAGILRVSAAWGQLSEIIPYLQDSLSSN